MGKCPSCGASYLLSTPIRKCGWCGKVKCKKCLPRWAGWFKIKVKLETTQKGPEYELIGFCSKECVTDLWKKITDYPLQEIGTDVNRFAENLRRLYCAAILHALSYAPNSREIIPRFKHAMQIETKEARGIPLQIRDDGMPQEGASPLVLGFINNGYTAFAQNLERCGRPLDAADIYEKRLKLYDKARELREKDKRVMVRRTDISVNLNALLQQLKDGGIVALYRCPHCNGTLKISKDTRPDSLKVCEHCGSQIETVDLADFLKTALS